MRADRPMVATAPASGASASIAAHGDFDLHTANLIGFAAAAAVGRGARHLVPDLSQATSFDYATLHALLNAAEPLRSEPDASVVFAGAQGIVRRFLDLVGVRQLVQRAQPRDNTIAGLRSVSPDQRQLEIAR
jgi:anti-anti-sigma regulatory factor